MENGGHFFLSFKKKERPIEPWKKSEEEKKLF